MIHTIRPFVQISVNAVDLVLLDPEETFDPDQFDRYESFEAARDAALTSIEVMLDEQDYDDEEHRRDLELMTGMLENAQSFEDLDHHPAYHCFLEALQPQRSAA